MTQDFSRSYLPPGVYVEEDESVVVSTGGLPGTLVALVGPARGFQIYTEQVTLSDDGVILAKPGILLAGTPGAAINITIAATGEVVGDDNFDLSATGSGAASITTLVRLGSDVDDGTLIWVTYNYTPADYYAPKFVTTYEDVTDLYGQPLNTTTGSVTDSNYKYVTSPLALAAKVAFDNGANQLVLCAAQPPTGSTDSARSTSSRTNLKAALDATETYAAINVIVPVTDGILAADASGVLTDVSAHINSALNDSNLRFAVVGFDAGVTTAPDTLLSTSGIQNRRVMLAYAGPGALLMFSSGVNANFTASHTYLAAAYSGKMSALPIQQALTQQALSSFVGLGGTPLSNALKNQYASAGVAVAQIDRLGRLVVRHGVTTDMTNVNTREASVVRARDALVTMIQNGFASAGITGQAIDDDLLFSVKSVMQGYLQTAVNSGAIVSYDALAVRQRPTDQTVVEIKFTYKPAYPLNYIAITFSIDTTTGTVSDTTDLQNAA